MRGSRTTLTRVLNRPEVIETHSSSYVGGPRDRLWAALVEPETSFHLQEGLVAAGRMPGTPAGVGEMQFHITENSEGERECSVLEVTEYEDGRRAVTRNISSGFPSGSEVTVSDAGHGRLLVVYRFWYEFPAGIPVDIVDEARRASTTSAAAFAERVTQVFG